MGVSDKYKISDDLIERVEISIPVNKNTIQILEKTRKDLYEYFKGLTVIKSQLGGIYIDEKNETHIEDILLLIIYYNPEEYLDAEEVLASIARRLLDCGGDDCWLIFQNAKRKSFAKV